MTLRDRQSGANLGRRVMRLNALTSGLGVVLVSVYLMLLLHLPREQWIGFFEIVALWYAILLPASTVHQKRFYRPILTVLSRCEAGTATPDDVRRAFTLTMDLPRRTTLSSLAWWGIGGVAVAGSMKVHYTDFSITNAVILLVGALSGGLLACVFLGFNLKQALSPTRETLAARVGLPEQRATWFRRVPLLWKLWVAIVAATLVPLGFSVLFLQVQASRPIEAMVSELGGQLLSLAIERWQRDGPPDLERLRSEARALGLESTAVVVDRRSGAVVMGSQRVLERSERRWIAQSDGERGDGLELDSSHVFVWRALPGTKRALAIAVPWSSLSGQLRQTRWVFGCLVLASLGVALGIAWLLARDLGSATRLLRAEAERMTSGDLRPGRVLESEDEVGELGRAFDRMAEALRGTLGGAAQASDRVEATAREMELLGDGVAAVTADQVRGIQQATVWMDGIHGQVQGIAQSSQRLSDSVDESSSSVLELGAAGEELSETASVLSEQAGTVTDSLEGVMGSVRQVADNTEALANAAEETSVSMDEMARSMRKVDAAAGEAGNLSLRVVEMAETGCAHVRETIVEMEAIRDATETAERVIRSLGERTQEIGAILDVIEDVADETNLLALNASIIAAQAGKNGRAFSVVADEIKELADRVLASTHEIAQVIRSVQAESTAAVGAVERGAASVIGGVERSAQAGVSLEEITRASRESGDRMEGIAAAVRQQTKAATHVAELMERVRAGVEQIRAATREQERGTTVVLGSSARMREVAHQVHRTTEAQARGTGRLQAGVEAVLEAVVHIHEALQEQSTACRQAAKLVEHVYERTRSNEQAAQRMGQTTRDLHAQAHGLRQQVQKFRL